jgi:hypothetical protein
MPPAVGVFCDKGTCAGTVYSINDEPDGSVNLNSDHCGVNGVSGTSAGTTAFNCQSKPTGSGSGS